MSSITSIKKASETKQLTAIAFELFSIANLVFMLGVILYASITDQFSLMAVNPTDFSTDIFTIFRILLVVINEPALAFGLVLGWIIAALYAANKYHSNVELHIVRSASIFALFMIAVLSPFILALLILGLTINTATFLSVLVLIAYLIAYTAGIAFALELIVAVPALIILAFRKKEKIASVHFATSQNLLVLPTQITTKPIKFCPMKDQNINGCGHLGYSIPRNIHLICDYESTFRACKIYAYLYSKHETLTKEEIK